MKGFFKMVFATMLGIILLQVLMFLVFIIFLVGSVASFSKGDGPTKVSPNTILELKFNGTINERNANDIFAFNMNSEAETADLQVMLNDIKKAKEDNNIKGISLQIEALSASFSTLEELRNALSDFKKSGKFIYSYSDNYSQGAYYLASVADKVCVNPHGEVSLYGLSTQVMFFKKLLDKMNIDMQIVKVGTYKSAVEPFILDKMSDANREQYTTLLNSVWNTILKQISLSRNIAVETINQDCDHLTILGDVNAALAKGYVDTLVYIDQYEDCLRAAVGQGAKSKLKYVSASQYESVVVNKNSSNKKIAVLYAIGNINDDEGSNTSIGSNMMDELKKLREDKNVKAVVFRINSGGGSALMSEKIWREVVKLKQEKPIVVSMSDVAASGGYYIACAANSIVAESNTITGSIGVFGMIPNIKKFMEDKVGIEVDQVTTNPHAAMSIFTPLDNEERAAIQRSVNQVYKTFTTRVAEGRGLTTQYVDSIGQGRVWSGTDALRLHLVDTLGGLDVAIAKAAQLANIKSYKVDYFPRTKDAWEQINDMLSDRGFTSMLQQSPLKETYTYMVQIEDILNRKGVQAMMPCRIEIR